MNPRNFSDAARYEIKLRGHLGHRSASRFQGFSIAEGFCDDGAPVTTLSGPVADQSALHGLLARIREFFASRKVLEVETPVLSRAANSDPNLTQITSADRRLWLRTSPEYAMKRLLAAGSGDVYELGRAFRQNEAGRFHNPEFTILEWYRTGWTYHQLMGEVAELV